MAQVGQTHVQSSENRQNIQERTHQCTAPDRQADRQRQLLAHQQEPPHTVPKTIGKTL